MIRGVAKIELLQLTDNKAIRDRVQGPVRSAGIRVKTQQKRSNLSESFCRSLFLRQLYCLTIIG